MARYLPKGNLEFRGRADHQVKIRGIRIELGEIEAALRAHEHITQAVVVAGAHASGRKQLVAYIVAKPNTPPIKINELRTALRQRLPDYMLPTAVVQLPTLPMTPNGKTDRRALPAPEPGAEMGRAPRTPQEEILCLIFAEALGIDSVGVDSDFFACGGHSLLVMRLINQIRSVLRVDLPLRTVFESPTPGGLASRLNEAGSVERALTRRPQTGRLPLSFAQRQLWLIDRLEGGAAEYNTPIALRLRGRVDLSALEQAVNEIVARHEVLRACFRLAEEEPIQQILPALTIEMPLEDLSSMGEATKREAISAAIRGEWEQPFDLAQGPLLRMRLLKLADQEHLWILTFHHIVFDARSLAIFNSELTVLYEAFHERRENPLPSLPLQYADFTLWQRDRADEETLERELNFWRRKLAGLPEQLGLLTDRPRPARQTFAADSCGMRVPAETATALKRLGQANQATLYMTLLSVFAVLLSRYSGQETVVVGSPIANREEPELEGLIGLFLNTLVMRVDVRAGESFDQLLAQVRATALEAYRHQTLPFERLVKELSSPRSLSSTPIFQVLFVLQNEPAGIPELKGLEVERVEINPQRARFDIEVHLRESTEGMEIRWVYNRDLFDRWRMEQMTRHFARLLEAASTRPQCRIGSLDMLSEEEKKTFAEWNRTERPIPPASLAELLEAQAERTPEAVAVISEQQQLTYAELNLRANQLAHALIGRGVGPEGLVGICLERSVEMIIAMAAVLKAGAAYLPLDTDYPPARVALMIDDAKPALILTSASVGLNACHSRPTMVLDDRDSARAIARNSQLNPGKRERERALSPAHPAYVIYTSGSTGTPKGVVMPAVALMNLLAWQRAAIPGSRGARTAQFTAFSFDVAAQEILSALTSGKTLVIPPGEVRRNPNDFAAWLEQHRISELFAPNLMIQALCRTATEHGRELESLTQIAQAGEALVLSDEVRDFFDLCPSGKRLHNHYGPSETHVTTACALPPDPAEWPMTASIGRPIWNTRIHLLDGNLELVPQGVIGELYVAGVAVARGYLNRSALTAERFWPDPYGAPGERMYRTGDLAWRRTDGALEFARRADHQIKIRGFRVEPGEIEATLRRVEGVKQCAVIACEDGPGMKRLVAYLVPGERYPGPDFLRQALRETLPDYMMPSAYVEMESLPLLPSGKLDRWSLPPLGVTERTAKTLPVMPQNRWESLIAAVWQEKLLLDKISIHDNFFEVGGHSLLAIQVHTELQKLTGRPLLLTDIFRYPTVASLAEYLARGEQKQELSDLNGGFDQLNQRLIARKERLKRRPRKPQI